MTIAICIKCGAEKLGSFTPCKACNFSPSTHPDLARSMVLSDHYLDTPALELIGHEISETGICPKIPKEKLEEIIKQIENDRLILSISEINKELNVSAKTIKPIRRNIFKKLSELPLHIFCLIAGADGDIDAKEKQAFLNVLRHPVCRQTFSSPIFKSFFYFNEFDQDKLKNAKPVRDISDRYASSMINMLQEHYGDREISEFIQDIHTLGRLIANASGGMLGFGEKVSREEKRALNRLAVLFPTSSEMVGVSVKKILLTDINRFKNIFEEIFNKKPKIIEIAAYTVSVYDFFFQASTSDILYKKGMQEVIYSISGELRLQPRDLISSIQERARVYVGMTLKTFDAITKNDDERGHKAMVQLAWEFYFNTLGANPKGDMISLISVLGPEMTQFTIRIMKTSGDTAEDGVDQE